MALFSGLEMCRGCRCPGWAGRCEKWPGLPRTGHSWFQPLPASSNQFQLAPTYPPPGTAQPHSKGGGASGKKYLGKGKTLCRKQVGTKKKKKRWEKEPCEQQGQSRRRGRRRPKQRFSCSPWRNHGGADGHTTAHGEQHAGAGRCFLKELRPMESPCWSRFILKELHPV